VSLIRVLVANRPRLIRELVTATISDQPDIEVVGEVQHESDLESVVQSKQPDVVIVALDNKKELPHACWEILREHPQLRVIAVAPDRNSSMYFWAYLQIESRQIETSEAGVLSAIRGNASPAEGLQ
jgi:DNA-binding NarL/FixJ family response regulator